LTGFSANANVSKLLSESITCVEAVFEGSGTPSKKKERVLKLFEVEHPDRYTIKTASSKIVTCQLKFLSILFADLLNIILYTVKSTFAA
jgi:hypothetical protein